jgi:hypothetical protein
MKGIKEEQGGGGWEEPLVQSLMGLPHKILQNHEVEDLAPIVLHELGHDCYFDLDKAIYLVDNPDFDCVKGIAGFSRDECKFHNSDLWQNPNSFSIDMKNAIFHTNLKKFLARSIQKKEPGDVLNSDEICDIGLRFGIKNPSFLNWRMKHGNNGILIFEARIPQMARKKELLMHAGSLLSFC